MRPIFIFSATLACLSPTFAQIPAPVPALSQPTDSDEPEISLNVKWQRRLVRALLDCIRGSRVQLVFATHSIELLAQHKTNVIKLSPWGKGRGGKRRVSLDEPGAPDDSRVGSQV